MQLPEQVTPEWLQATVPDLTQEELTDLARALRALGWSDADLAVRVLSLRGENVPLHAPEGHETVSYDRTTVPPPSTESDPPSPLGPILTRGSTFAGYLIEAVAGRGGMGVVYRAREARPNRTVALKVIAPELAADTEFRGRFERESDIAATIEHPNVLPIFRAGEDSGLLYLAMRYVEGTDLAAMIADEGRLEPRRAVDVIVAVCDALDAAHARGLVHRDVKPANVLIARQEGMEHVYLTDFGIAKRVDATGGPTLTGFFMGTLDYAAPEQIQGGRVDARTDIYATGCMLFHAVAGSVPFPADNPAARVYAHLSTTPPSLRDVDPTLPEQLDEVVHRAMAKDPNDRYLSAGDLGRAAKLVLEGAPLSRADANIAIGEAADRLAGPIAVRVWPGGGDPKGPSGAVDPDAAAAERARAPDASSQSRIGGDSRRHAAQSGAPVEAAEDESTIGSDIRRIADELKGGFRATASDDVEVEEPVATGDVTQAGLAGSTEDPTGPPTERPAVPAPGRETSVDATPPAGIVLQMWARRRWLAPLAVVTVVAVAIVTVLFPLSSRERSYRGTGAVQSSIAISSVTTFDPFGDGEEHDADLSNLTDGRPDTTWRTQTYLEPFGVGTSNSKPGVGLIIESGGVARHLLVSPDNFGWRAQVYAADRPASSLDGWGAPVARRSGIRGDVSFDLGRRSGHAILLWITELGEGNVAAIRELRLTATATPPPTTVPTVPTVPTATTVTTMTTCGTFKVTVGTAVFQVPNTTC